MSITTKRRLLLFGPVYETKDFTPYLADSMTDNISLDSSLQQMGIFTGLM